MINKVLIIIVIVSTASMIAWLISDFFGGMIIFLNLGAPLIIPLVIIYLITLIITFIKVIISGISSNLIIFCVHSLGLSLILISILYHSELLKSKIILEATLLDDLSSITLILRESGSFETIMLGMFGVEDRIYGDYKIRNDTIFFMDHPYDNDFIPDTLAIDMQDSAIYFNKDEIGDFSREKSFVNYFEISKYEY